jgi:hypothetical protein
LLPFGSVLVVAVVNCVILGCREVGASVFWKKLRMLVFCRFALYGSLDGVEPFLVKEPAILEVTGWRDGFRCFALTDGVKRSEVVDGCSVVCIKEQKALFDGLLAHGEGLVAVRWLGGGLKEERRGAMSRYHVWDYTRLGDYGTSETKLASLIIQR